MRFINIIREIKETIESLVIHLGPIVKTWAVDAGRIAYKFRRTVRAVKTRAADAGWVFAYKFRRAVRAVKTWASGAGWLAYKFRRTGWAVKAWASGARWAIAYKFRRAWQAVKVWAATAGWTYKLRRAWLDVKARAADAGRTIVYKFRPAVIPQGRRIPREKPRSAPGFGTGRTGSRVRDTPEFLFKISSFYPCGLCGLCGQWLKFLTYKFRPAVIPQGRRYGGLAILLVLFIINIFLLKQPGMRFPHYTSEDRTLVFTQWWENVLDTGTLAGLVREFEERNPDIRIRLDTRSYTEILELLARQDESGGGGEAGDILGLDPRWFAVSAITEQLEPLAEYAEYNEGGGNLHTGPYGEWGRPLVSFMMPLFYNIDLLEAAGFDRPPKNQTDFAAFAKAATDAAEGRYGFALALSPEDPQALYRDILSWVRSSGAFANWDGEPQFNTPEITATFSFLSGLSKDGSLAPGTFTKTGKDRLEEFREGRVAMLIASIADARLLRGAGFNCGITTIPSPTGYTGKPLYALDHWYVGISRNSKYKEEALAFTAFLARRVSLLADSSGAIPWNSNSNTTDSYAGEDPLLSKAYDIYHAGETRTEFAERRQSSLFEEHMTEELRLMFESNQTPEAAVKALQQHWEE